MAVSELLKRMLAQATTLEQLGLPSTLVTDLIFRMLFNEGEVSVGRFARSLTSILKSLTICSPRPSVITWSKLPKPAPCGSAIPTGSPTRGCGARVTRWSGRNILARPRWTFALRTGHLYPDRQQAPHTAGTGQAGAEPPGAAREFPPAHRPSHQRRVVTVFVRPVRQRQDHHRPGHCPAVGPGASLSGCPYAVTVGGQIIQIFDPVVHIPQDKTDSDKGEKLRRLN